MPATKSEYHIIYDDGTQIAKFTASKIDDVWKKYNKRCEGFTRINISFILVNPSGI